MPTVRMYCSREKRFKDFPMKCTPDEDRCETCALALQCDKIPDKPKEEQKDA